MKLDEVAFVAAREASLRSKGNVRVTISAYFASLEARGMMIEARGEQYKNGELWAVACADKYSTNDFPVTIIRTEPQP